MVVVNIGTFSPPFINSINNIRNTIFLYHFGFGKPWLSGVRLIQMQQSSNQMVLAARVVVKDCLNFLVKVIGSSSRELAITQRNEDFAVKILFKL